MLAVATVAPTRELGPALSIRQTKINQPAARTLQGRLMAFIYLGRLQAGMGKWVCQDFATTLANMSLLCFVVSTLLSLYFGQ